VTVDEVLADVSEGIGRITLNRPDKRNALTQRMLTAMLDALNAFDDNPDVRVVWLTAAGATFCSGMDLADMQSAREAKGSFDYELLPEVFHRIAGQKNPTVATVQGAAVAGGCELALHCDIRIGSPDTRLSMPLARLGLVTPIEAVERLVHTAGMTATQDMLFTGEPVHGERAERLGLLSRVESTDSLAVRSEEIVRRIAQNAPLSLRTMKRMIDSLAPALPDDVRAPLEAERLRVSTSEDMREGLRAFFERRPAVFRGV
jgi:enoyl-CoA hydratase/carnithine racemase